jgi:hypothetical protein
MKNYSRHVLIYFFIVVISYEAAYCNVSPKTILIEAEGFGSYGGWVLDSQFMDQMGSSYLMAHGLGKPVEDAETQIEITVSGIYRVFVRTFNWVAPFDAPGTPGCFKLELNGIQLQEVFGTKGKEWSWQTGGSVELSKGFAKLKLIDLTGFNGRCDAIILTTDPNFVPPNQPELLSKFRQEVLEKPILPVETGPYDLIVVGGGMAGSSAAVSSARLGLRVALIQDRPVLGGNNSSEIRVPMRGGVHWPPYNALGGVVYELGPEHHSPDSHKENVIRLEPNIDLFLNTRMVKVETEGQKIKAIIGQNVRTNQQTRFIGKLFADCTGDGNLGYFAGADYRYGRESLSETGESDAPLVPDSLVMGATLKWQSNDTKQLVNFPDTPWALEFNEETCLGAKSGSWNWEAGFRWHQVNEAEKIRDHLLRAIFGNWSYQKNHFKERHLYNSLELEQVSYILGKRESRRLLGDIILKEQDIVERRFFPDAAVVTTWSIDVHYPHPENSIHYPKMEFLAEARFFHDIEPYPIPYRCLYSRNIDNLFMAGRNISVTHVALGTVRVMYTGGMMGEVVGMAAAVCWGNNATPRQVYTNHLEELKEFMKHGVGRLPVPPEPPWQDVNFLPGHLMRQYRQAREALGINSQGLGVHETIRKFERISKEKN